ncbi:MAG: hypothetical protein KQH57_11565 [Actinomycetales bacterium]|nr:hypothetical protein [Actinomycetales bacterium]
MSDQLASIAVIGTGILLAILGVLVTIFVASGRRDARRRRGEPVIGAGDRGRVESDAASTASLRRRANASLVAIDDALRNWEQELGFAQAQFGSRAAAPLQAAVATAKGRVARAFALRGGLDDAAPSSEARVREVATEIIRICHEVTRDLDTHAHDFDSERAAQAHTPALLDELSRKGRLLGARSAAARRTLEALAHSYPAVALAAVSANPDLVDALADEAAASVAAGRDALAEADRAAAAAAARAAQSAVDRATGLLDDVDQLPAQLQDAASHLDAAVAVLREEIARAEQLAPADPTVGSAASAATAALAAAQDARADGDLVSALRAVTQQRAELATALATSRERAGRAEQARSRLTELLDQTNARIGAVTAYIDTHRDAVGADARTRLAAGVRHADQALAQTDGEPEKALMAAATAARLVGEAQALAEHDVATAGGNGPQWLGGASPGSSGSAELVLGGVLVDQLLRGHGRGLRGRGC